MNATQFNLFLGIEKKNVSSYVVFTEKKMCGENFVAKLSFFILKKMKQFEYIFKTINYLISIIYFFINLTVNILRFLLFLN